jgi:hypothetical protein
VTLWTVMTVIVIVCSAVDGVTVWPLTVIVIVCSAVDGVTVWTVTTVIMIMLYCCEECDFVDRDDSDYDDSDNNVSTLP